MDLELYPKSGSPVIEGYGEGYIKILGNKISNTFILFPDKMEEIKEHSTSSIINSFISYKENLDLVIYGSYRKIDTNMDLLNNLKSISLPIEFMHTFSACRTWSVLISEGRSVSAIIEPKKYKI